ncbi:hypothetical protein BAB79_20275 [Mycobacteroides abscessus]|nr:hypothetical protein A3O06_20280 [Mycobacteroides abscessus]ANO25577.1 hypothetical protein BAB79_20275 [Mycobacteroides abscessus]
MEAAVDAFCAESIEDLTAGEVLARLEVVQRRLFSRGLRLVPKVTGQASPTQLGATSFPEVLCQRLHMGKGAARRRIADAEQLAPRCQSGAVDHLACRAVDAVLMQWALVERVLPGAIQAGLCERDDLQVAVPLVLAHDLVGVPHCAHACR